MASRALAAPRESVRADDIFFSAMAVLILGIVVTGFGRSYFLAGTVFAPLPSVLVHVHGAVFVSWILLLLAQTALIAVRWVKAHMTLGLIGFVLPPAMLLLGLATMCESLRRAQLPVPPPKLLLIANTEQLLLFAGLTAWGIALRYRTAEHKRLMLLGTLTILPPAVDRWHLGPAVTVGVSVLLPLAVVFWDIVSRRRVMRVSAIGFALIAACHLTVVPLMRLPVWDGVLAWIKR